MSLLVKITLAAALILSIVVPFGAFAMGEKTKGRYKTAFRHQCIPVLRYLDRIFRTDVLRQRIRC